MDIVVDARNFALIVKKSLHFLTINGIMRLEAMRMKRFAMDKLAAWKNTAGRKPIIISGARQVGKT